MRISFDLDDLLICYQPGTPCEPNRVPFFLRPWLNEPLRLGARELMRELTGQGHELWIYTTSLRDRWHVRLWLRCYGIRIVRVLNGADNDAALRDCGDRRSYKIPSYFDIDLHIDDAEGLDKDGRRHGFAAVTVSPDDPNWTNKVRAAVAGLTV